MADPVTPRPEDLMPVRSRVSWGAILAGAMIAMAVYFILALLGTAIGFSISDRVRYETLSVAAAIWALFGAIVALFVGGWVTTQLAVGENKMEAIVHGVIMWGVVFAVLMWLAAAGVRSGLNAMVGLATVSRGSDVDWEAQARRAGVSQEDINAFRAKMSGNADANVQVDQQTATAASWWALLGVVLSIAAAAGGAVVGSGPTWRLIPVRTGTRILLEDREGVMKS